MSDHDPLSFEGVLEEELQDIALLRVRRGVRAESRPETRAEAEPAAPVRPPPTVTAKAHRQQLVGLAFSGGGIRSATFNLGILQALAQLGLLRYFDYLSTVSGGGYIGSWLTAWISRHGMDEVSEGLAREHEENPSRGHDTPPSARRADGPTGPITFLRSYANYLTPKTGFFSLDTWMAIATYTRNLILNLHVLVFALACVLLVPWIFVAGVLKFNSVSHWWAPPAIAALSLLVAWAVAIKFETAWTDRHSWVSSGSGVFWTLVVPVFLIGLCLVCWLFGAPRSPAAGYLAIAGGLVYVSFYVLVGAFCRLLWIQAGRREGGKGLAQWRLLWRSLLPAFAAGAAGGLLLWLLMNSWPTGFAGPGDWLRVMAWGPPGVVLILTLAGVYFVGLMGRSMPEAQRQWWSRVGGSLAILAGGWLALFLTVFYAPVGLRWAASETPKLIGSIGLGWLVSTALGVVAGRSPATNARESNRLLELAVGVAPFVFIIGLVMSLSLGLDAVIRGLFERPEAVVSRIWPDAVSSTLNGTAGWLADELPGLMLVGVALAAVTAVLSLRIDINEFSMHNFYRDRLTRAYLGASRKRTPNPFSGFDRDDDLDLTKLLDEKAVRYDGPYPIVNTTLNLTAGDNELAWQERKASSFVFTPRHHGYELRLPRSVAFSAYRPSAGLDSANEPRLSLGTAMTISGAAVNPNMGYHSSSALSFLLTVFNARLGLWMGNPAHPTTWNKKSPTWSLTALLNELLGQTGTGSKYVNLADGGFFDNLGIYELVRRRCRFILACDAEADPELKFDGLGNVIRRCRSDFGIDIRFENLEPIKRTGDGPFSHWHCAVGSIFYDMVDERAPRGILVYIKASLTGDEPADILNYQRKFEQFPHESTADQWFGESQFESYRRLGEHIGRVVFEAVDLRPRR